MRIAVCGVIEGTTTSLRRGDKISHIDAERLFELNCERAVERKGHLRKKEGREKRFRAEKGDVRIEWGEGSGYAVADG